VSVGPAQTGTGERVYVAGWFTSATSILGLPVSPSGGQDGFVAELSTDGTTERVITLGGTGGEQAFRASASEGGELVIAGHLGSAFSFGTFPLSFAGMTDGYVVGLAGAVPRLAVSLGGPALDRISSAVGYADGSTIGAARFAGPFTLGGSTIDTAGSEDGLVVAYAPDGSVRWSRAFAGAAYDDAIAIDRGPGTWVAVGGRFDGPADLGGVARTGAGSDDGFVTVLDGEGTNLWTETIGGTFSDVVWDVVMLDDGSVVALISTFSPLDFGAGPAPGGAPAVMIVRWSP
jgi:hypothetical protein